MRGRSGSEWAGIRDIDEGLMHVCRLHREEYRRRVMDMTLMFARTRRKCLSHRGVRLD